MPMPDNATSLDERVHEHREELLVLMADTGRCEDIVSGVLTGDLGDDEVTGAGLHTPEVSTSGVTGLVTDGAVAHTLTDDDPLGGVGA